MITSILEADFELITPMRRVITHDNARKFAQLQLPNFDLQLGLSWPSELVEPIVVEDTKSSAWWLGVDQQVVCIQGNGRIRFAVSLNSPLLTIEVFPSLTVILCTTSFLVISNDATVLHSEESNDMFDSMNMIESKVIVNLLDGGYRTYP